MTVKLKKEVLTVEQAMETKKAVRDTLQAVSKSSVSIKWKLGTLSNLVTGMSTSFWDAGKKDYNYTKYMINSTVKATTKLLVDDGKHWVGNDIEELLKIVRTHPSLPKKKTTTNYTTTYKKQPTTQERLLSGAKVADPANYTGFTKELLELLLIQAPSGEEEKVRDYLIPILAGGLVDSYEIDAAGNLLAIKKCGTGEGATVMLSAHMDSVSNIAKDRIIYDNKGTFFTSDGALGADDRAGIAVVLGALRAVDNTAFNGTIKVAFPVSEEIGCIGSSAMNVAWYDDSDLAIVIDRRGSRDIVTGCNTPWNFCSEKVGEFFEGCSALLDMDYKCVGGGVSDAMTFSDNGVNSVNLSAGYYNEHTSNEYVIVNQTIDTMKLVVQALALVNDFYHEFGEVPASYSYGYGGYKSSYKYSDDDEWFLPSKDMIDIYAEGRTRLVEDGQWLDIKQQSYMPKGAVTTISMHHEDFVDMIDAYVQHLGYPSLPKLAEAYKELNKLDK